MKKHFGIMLVVLTLALAVLPFVAMAEGNITQEPPAGEPFTWQYLASIAGAAAFTLLVVQFFKVPLDKVWKIPTRVLAYVIALIVMLVATAFTSGLTLQTALLAAVNALIAALTAMGGYEVTFKKMENKEG